MYFSFKKEDFDCSHHKKIMNKGMLIVLNIAQCMHITCIQLLCTYRRKEKFKAI